MAESPNAPESNIPAPEQKPMRGRLRKFRRAVRRRQQGKTPQQTYKRLSTAFEGLGEEPSRRQRARVGALGGAYRQSFLKSRPAGRQKAAQSLYRGIEGYKAGAVKEYVKAKGAGTATEEQRKLVQAIRARRAEFQAQGPKGGARFIKKLKKRKRPTGGTTVPSPNTQDQSPNV